jgi:hypothetical protein
MDETTLRSWQVSPVRGSSETRRWRPMFCDDSFVLGMDVGEQWVRFVVEAGTLIPADAQNFLFFLPLLDVEPSAFFEQIDKPLDATGNLRERAVDLLQKTLCVALRQRSDVYIHRAMTWLDSVPVNNDVRGALLELGRSKRGTQRLRQCALERSQRSSR